jgi:hypothetical protein
MSLSIDGNAVLLMLLVPAGLVAAFATVPRWFARSLSKHALWRLRDDVVDDVIDGRLPSGDAAVQELVARVEWAIEESRSFDLLHLIVWSRARRTLPLETSKRLAVVPDLKKLSTDQASRVIAHRKRFDRVAIRAVLLSSWLGVAVVFWTAIPFIFRELTNRQKRQVGMVFREATAEAAAETRFGQLARDYVETKAPALEPSPALVAV